MSSKNKLLGPKRLQTHHKGRGFLSRGRSIRMCGGFRPPPPFLMGLPQGGSRLIPQHRGASKTYQKVWLPQGPPTKLHTATCGPDSENAHETALDLDWHLAQGQAMLREGSGFALQPQNIHDLWVDVYKFSFNAAGRCSTPVFWPRAPAALWACWPAASATVALRRPSCRTPLSEAPPPLSSPLVTPRCLRRSIDKATYRQGNLSTYRQLVTYPTPSRAWFSQTLFWGSRPPRGPGKLFHKVGNFAPPPFGRVSRAPGAA